MKAAIHLRMLLIAVGCLLSSASSYAQTSLPTASADRNDNREGVRHAVGYPEAKDNFANITSAPEPGAALLGGIGLLLLMRRMRQ